MAESWTSSADGLTWTYKMRPDMKWSDGEPMTADDVKYTIDRANEEHWNSHITITANLTATVVDANTLVIKTSVPDPRLPTLGAYILPKHIYEKVSAEDLPNYTAEDKIGGGPFMLGEVARSSPASSEPQLVRQEAGDGRSDLPLLRRPERRVPGTEERRDRCARQCPRAVVRQHREQRHHRGDRWQPGQLQRVVDELRLLVVAGRRQPGVEGQGSSSHQLRHRPRPARREDLGRSRHPAPPSSLRPTRRGT